MSRKKLYHNTIKGITNPAMQRIARKAGAHTIQGIVYNEVRGLLRNNFLEVVVKKCMLIMEYMGAKTLSREMVRVALVLSGVPTVGGRSLKACKIRPTKKSSKKTSRKRKGGALKDMRYYQNQAACTHIPQAAFVKLIREIMRDYTDKDIRISKDAALLLQVSAEAYLGRIFKNAKNIALHNGRKKVTTKDIVFSNRISKAPH